MRLRNKTRGHHMELVIMWMYCWELPFWRSQRNSWILFIVIGCLNGNYCQIISVLSHGTGISLYHSFDGTLLAIRLQAVCDSESLWCLASSVLLPNRGSRINVHCPVSPQYFMEAEACLKMFAAFTQSWVSLRIVQFCHAYTRVQHCWGLFFTSDDR